MGVLSPYLSPQPPDRRSPGLTLDDRAIPSLPLSAPTPADVGWGLMYATGQVGSGRSVARKDLVEPACQSLTLLSQLWTEVGFLGACSVGCS